MDGHQTVMPGRVGGMESGGVLQSLETFLDSQERVVRRLTSLNPPLREETHLLQW